MTAGKNGWMPIETAPESGAYLVWLSKARFGNHVFPASCRTGGVKIVGTSFYFDMPAATHWRELPPPPDLGTEES